MTRTKLWFELHKVKFRRIQLGSAVLFAVGAVLFGLAVGVGLGRVGLYSVSPMSVFFGWLVAAAGAVWGAVRHRASKKLTASANLAAQAELATGSRRGYLSGLIDDLPGSASPGLGALADENASTWLEENGSMALGKVRHSLRVDAGRSAVTALAGIVVLVAAGPTTHAGARFWNPLVLVAEANLPIELTAEKLAVQFGEMVGLKIVARGRVSAELWERSLGEEWSLRTLVLDSAGGASVTLGPLDSDRFIRASSGSRESETLHIVVALPSLLTELTLLARFPTYLDMADQPLVPGAWAVLPMGTEVISRGRVTLDLGDAGWGNGDTLIPLEVDGTVFSGSFVVRESATWVFSATTVDGTPVDAGGSVISIDALRDSAPVVVVAIPGVDTTPPLSLMQPLVVDVRDDHLVTRAEIVSRRAGGSGLPSPPLTEQIPLPVGGTGRAILQWVLDLNNRGFVPGDTAFYRVRVWDNYPGGGQLAESREFFLWFPSLHEMRSELRQRSDAVAAMADSLARMQGELSRIAGELATERNRAEGGEQLDFNSAERAQQLEKRQQQLLDQVRQLKDQISELTELAREAGISDPEFFQKMAEIRELMEKALSSELMAKLEELRNALERLDSRSTREALQNLQLSQEELEEQLERARDLFERAALEGEMSALAEEAEELARQQDEWSEAAAVGDSGLALSEEALAAATDSLAQRLAEIARQMSEMGAGEGMQPVSEEAREAANQMSEAARMAVNGNMEGASNKGRSAGELLEGIPESIREQRDRMRDQWREEVLDALDRALSEIAELVRNQSDLAGRYQSGDLGPNLPGDQAAIREGVDRVIEELQGASSQNALVSPRLSAALGFSMIKMTEVLQNLSQASPNARDAAEAAEAAVDGLNQVAHGLVRSRSDVEGAESGSGVEEAIERMNQMALQQQGLTGAANQLLPMMSMGGDQLIQQLRQLAMQQMQLAEELERLEAESDFDGLSELADEARAVARRLEAAQLDQNTIRRQEQLFRRMLDAGRTLRSERPDDRMERRSERVAEGVPRVPDRLAPGATGRGARFEYPSWESLSRLSPDDRRLVLDYFRRLNEPAN